MADDRLKANRMYCRFMHKVLQPVELHIPRDAETSELLHALDLLLQRYEVTNGHATVVLSGERLSLARSIVAALSERDSPRR
jgi:hypothetical protein